MFNKRIYSLILATAFSVVFISACSHTKPTEETRVPSSVALTEVVEEKFEKEDEVSETKASQQEVEPQEIVVSFTKNDFTGSAPSYTKRIEQKVTENRPESYVVQVPDYIKQEVWDYQTCSKQVPVRSVEWDYDSYRRHEAYKKLEQLNRTETSRMSAYERAAFQGRQASQLAEAIQGLGKEYAEKLIKNNYFSHQIPRSWNEFALAINGAVSRGYLTEGHRTNILDNYEVENKSRLGVYPRGVVEYKNVQSRCYVLVGYRDVQVGSHSETRVRTVKVQKGVIIKNVRIQFTQAPALLPNEKETMSFYFSGEQGVSYSDPKFNRYSVSAQTRVKNQSASSSLFITEQDVNITVGSSLRKKVNIKEVYKNELIKDVVLSNHANGLEVKVFFDTQLMEFVRQYSRKPLYLSYAVGACKPKWGFLFPCKWKFTQKYKDQKEVRSNVETFIIQDGILNGKDWKYRVEASLNFGANEYYSGDEVDEKVSDPILRK